MKTKLLVLTILILIVLAALFFKKSDRSLDNAVNQPAPEEPINFVMSGNVIKNNPGLKPDVWYLNYEAPGTPGLNLELKFDDKSVCNFLDVAKPCSNLAIGDRVGIQGVKQNDVFLVRILNMNIFNKK